MKVLLVDDHPLFREGIEQLLAVGWPQMVCAGANTLAEALLWLSQGNRPDLILLDLLLPDSQGSGNVVAVRARCSAPIVCISSEEATGLVIDCIDRGASGFIPKSSSFLTMRHALETILSGGLYLPTSVLACRPGVPAAAKSRRVAQGQIPCNLTERQSDVLRLLLRGLSNKEICSELDISPATVKTHISAILRTLNVSSRTQAVLEVSRLGLRL